MGTSTKPSIQPVNSQQRALIKSIRYKTITIATGAAGTGKTLIAIATLLDLLRERHIRKIVIVRLISDSFDEHLGALPGEKDSKLLHFGGSVIDNLEQILNKTEISAMFAKGLIEITPVSHARGRSFVDTGVLVEEAQNLTDSMVLLLLTRVGQNSRLVFTGDPDQVDYPDRCGINYAAALISGLKDAEVVKMDSETGIVRHPIISHILKKAKSLKESNLNKSQAQAQSQTRRELKAC